MTQDSLKLRLKYIRIAEDSKYGWATVEQLKASKICDTVDEEKQLRKAEKRAAEAATFVRPPPFKLRGFCCSGFFFVFHADLLAIVLLVCVGKS